ncbi:lipocalin-like domain-containing protein, partial [Enterobacter hormaechei]|uniref:lipocalin-like domain-containing protein n=2 Tax=Pseudomonadota TaxID=1224 RepID=UPI0013D0E5E5
MQIFRPDRPAFASGDKTRGTAEEYRQAVLGSSTHFGRVSIDPGKHQLAFDVEAASFPNWEGKRQVRDYT